ncbi:MAG: molybdenum ABC transporter ATP-binding protein [Marinibacterium sp.]|nr:molybdenum ABC transporter ATP-binding protein [Marinibacterium sp.]
MSLAVQIRHARPGFAMDVQFDAPGGVTALFGRSGAGKTTLVNAVAGLLQPDAGRVVLGERVLFDRAAGIALPPYRRRVGYVFQDGRLFPHLSVRRNLLYGRRFAGLRGPGDLAQVVDLLGLGPLLSRRPAGLSGGEKQRVAIGRALLSEPDLLLLDEPLAALDMVRKGEILPYLERIRDQARIPMLYVSHSVEEIARLANTVVALHQGGVLRAGPAAEVLADPRVVPAFGVRQLGSMLGGRVLAHHADGLTELALSSGRLLLPRVAAPVGADLRVRIAAQDVLLALAPPVGISALNILPCEIRQIRQGDGPGVVVQLQAGRDLLLARVTRRSATALDLRPGLAVYAVLKSVSVAQMDVGADSAP